MKKYLMCIIAGLGALSCSRKAADLPVSPIGEETISSLVSTMETPDRALLERGVRQAAFLWRSEDGSEEEFIDFVKGHYAADPQERKELYDRLARAFELIEGSFNQLTIDLQKPTVLSGPEPGEVDYILSAFSPYDHLSDDFYANKLAFITVLNFPEFTLEEKNRLGRDWSRLEWAYARMGDRFTTRVPAEVSRLMSEASSAAENYIAGYDIVMDKLVTEDGRQLFPDGMRLLAHWNLRDEIKSNYADVPYAQEKQEMIYKVMERIVNQDIPEEVIADGSYVWAPYSNKVWKDGELVSTKPEGSRRYSHILDIFHAYQACDPYCPAAPDAISRNFEESMEVGADEIEALFVKLVSSEQVRKVGALISSRLGRKLRPYDIWYDGFKSRSALPEDRLTAQTRRLYPDAEAFHAGMPSMLTKLGFSKEYADFLADRIAVEGARGSGHAWGAQGRGYKSYLRTRTGADGMDYKGYNIAVHEFGHNVEQTIDLYDIDYYTLAGVPNTAFTETLAFIFQKRDLQLLGYDRKADDNQTLDIFWGMYEIMGVSLVDMYTWRWLYEHPEADAEALRDNCLRIAREVWNRYYEPVLGTHDSPILAIYSHMVNAPMYLPNYPFGHIVEFQIEQHFAQLPDPDNIGDEILRIWKAGCLTPQEWMRQAVGTGVSVDPVLEAVEKIVG